jgi:hypothetical protein
MAAAPSVDRAKLDKAAVTLPMLQKRDPHVRRVLLSCVHVALYDFDDRKQAWARTQFEGSLHLVERDVDPRYQLILLNKLNPENKVEDITPDFQIQNLDPYMLYKNKVGDTHGVWFYNAGDREAVCNFISSLEDKDMLVPAPVGPPAEEPDAEQNIMRFFSKPPVASQRLPPAPVMASQLPPPLVHQPSPPAAAFHQPSQFRPPGISPYGGFPDVQAKPVTAPEATAQAGHIIPAVLTPSQQNVLSAIGLGAASGPGVAPSSQRAPNGAILMTKAQLKSALQKLIEDEEFLDLVYKFYHE